MNTEFVLLWIATLLPIIISPGPANILYAASGSAFGVRATVPFWLSTNLTSLFQTLAVGFGLNFLTSSHPDIANTMKYLGIIFLFYLAFRFFTMSPSYNQALAPLSFRDGVIVELFNMKYLMIPTIMFSQFYSPETDSYIQIISLALALVSLTLSSGMIWIVGGKSLALLVADERSQKIQRLFFGSSLCITAFCLLIS